MEWISSLFGNSTDLTVSQMLIRGIIVFILAVAILRVAGKRTFGKQSAADNIIMIMLGALLSRAITGASPFVPVIITSFGIVVLHRFLAWWSLHNQTVERIIKGDKVCLFKDGKIVTENMKNTLISKEDIMEGMRAQLNSDSLEKAAEIFIERNGHITIIKNN